MWYYNYEAESSHTVVSFTVEFAFEEPLYTVCEGIQYVEVCISVQGQRFGLPPVIDIFTVEESASGIIN